MKKWKQTAGFTLVELIVVIAILGILAGVGTVGYSGYIKKANMAADQQLASGVASILQLEYYSDMNTTGYVILRKDQAPSVADHTISSQKLADALATNFGSLDALKLKSDWSITNDLLTAALTGSAVGNSSYATNSTPGELLGNVQTVVGAATEVLARDRASTTQVVNLLGSVLGTDYLEKAANAGVINKTVNGENVTYTLKEGTYTTTAAGKVNLNQDLQNQLSNMMVFGVAEEMKDMDTEDLKMIMLNGLMEGADIPKNPDDTLKYSKAAELAAKYAFYKAFAVDMGAEESFNDLNARIAGDERNPPSLGGTEAALAEFVNNNRAQLQSYVENPNPPANPEGINDLFSDVFKNNAAAIPQIMSGVGAVENSYSDAASLANGNLYTSGGIANDLTAYINVAGMDADARAALQAAVNAAGENAVGGMIITVGPNGVNNPALD